MILAFLFYFIQSIQPCCRAYYDRDTGFKTFIDIVDSCIGSCELYSYVCFLKIGNSEIVKVVLSYPEDYLVAFVLVYDDLLDGFAHLAVSYECKFHSAKINLSEKGAARLEMLEIKEFKSAAGEHIAIVGIDFDHVFARRDKCSGLP